MKGQWPRQPLSECVRFLSGGTPSKKRTEFWEGDIPWVSSGEMATTRISDTALHISEQGLEDGSRLVPEDTVLAVVRGMSLAKDFRVAITTRPVAFNQDLKALACTNGTDPRFLFYALRAQRNAIRDLSSEASHGTKKLPTPVLGAVEVPQPAPDIQRRVADVLWQYDDLIENNRRRIQLLEQAARLLYKEWFVHLRFPGHEQVTITDGVPEAWEKKPLGDVAPLKYGKALKKDDRTPGPFPVYGSSGVVGTHVKPLIPGPTIIVGRKGNVGSVFWSSEDCHPIDTVYYIDTSRCSFHLYYALQHMSFISTDVAVPGLNRDFAHSRSVLVPERKLLRLFEETVTPLHQQIDVLRKANVALETARDLLLPRLMNGEIAA